MVERKKTENEERQVGRDVREQTHPRNANFSTSIVVLSAIPIASQLMFILILLLTLENLQIAVDQQTRLAEQVVILNKCCIKAMGLLSASASTRERQNALSNQFIALKTEVRTFGTVLQQDTALSAEVDRLIQELQAVSDYFRRCENASVLNLEWSQLKTIHTHTMVTYLRQFASSAQSIAIAAESLNIRMQPDYPKFLLAFVLTGVCMTTGIAVALTYVFAKQIKQPLKMLSVNSRALV